jgi:hypothetical protein
MIKSYKELSLYLCSRDLFMNKKELSLEAKKIIKILMAEENMSYIDLQKKLERKGYIYTADAIRSKVFRGTYDIRFLIEVAESLDKNIKLVDKIL